MNKFLVLCAFLAAAQASAIGPQLLEARTLGSSIITGDAVLGNGLLSYGAGLGSPLIAARSSLISAPLSAPLLSQRTILADASPLIATRTIAQPILAQQAIAAPIIRSKSLIDNGGLSVRSEIAPVWSQPILAQQAIATPIVRSKSLIDNGGLAVRSETAPIWAAPAPILADGGVIAARTIAQPILAQQTIAAPVLRSKSLIDNAGLSAGVWAGQAPLLAPQATLLAEGSPVIAARTLGAPLGLNGGLAWSNGYGLARSAAWNGAVLNGAVWNGARAGLIENW